MYSSKRTGRRINVKGTPDFKYSANPTAGFNYIFSFSFDRLPVNPLSLNWSCKNRHSVRFKFNGVGYD